MLEPQEASPWEPHRQGLGTMWEPAGPSLEGPSLGPEDEGLDCLPAFTPVCGWAPPLTQSWRRLERQFPALVCRGGWDMSPPAGGQHSSATL